MCTIGWAWADHASFRWGSNLLKVQVSLSCAFFKLKLCFCLLYLLSVIINWDAQHRFRLTACVIKTGQWTSMKSSTFKLISLYRNDQSVTSVKVCRMLMQMFFIQLMILCARNRLVLKMFIHLILVYANIRFDIKVSAIGCYMSFDQLGL